MHKLICLMLSLVVPISWGTAQEVLIGTGEVGRSFIPVVEELFREAGFLPSVAVYPRNRSLSLVETGNIQVDFFRSEAVLGPESTLRKFSPALLDSQVVAVTFDPQVAIHSLSDLKLYFVGYVKTSHAIENLLREVPKSIAALSTDNFFKMLEARTRFDVGILAETVLFNQYGRQLPPGLRVIPLPEKSVPLFMVYHVSFEPLAPRLEKILNTWVENGTWQKKTKGLFRTYGIAPPTPPSK